MIARTSSEFGRDARLPRTHSLVSQESVGKSLNSLMLDDGSYSQREVRVWQKDSVSTNVPCRLVPNVSTINMV